MRSSKLDSEAVIYCNKRKTKSELDQNLITHRTACHNVTLKENCPIMGIDALVVNLPTGWCY